MQIKIKQMEIKADKIAVVLAKFSLLYMGNTKILC